MKRDRVVCVHEAEKERTPNLRYLSFNYALDVVSTKCSFLGQKDKIHSIAVCCRFARRSNEVFFCYYFRKSNKANISFVASVVLVQGMQMAN